MVTVSARRARSTGPDMILWPLIVGLGLWLVPSPSVAGQLTVGVWMPSVSLGIQIADLPALALVPGYPVYYAPSLRSIFSSTTACSGSIWTIADTRGSGMTVRES